MAVSAVTFKPAIQLDDEIFQQRIREAKAKLGSKLMILGHHYQREEVFQHALEPVTS